MPAPPPESEPAMVSAIAVMSGGLADFREPGKHFQDPAGDQRHGVGEEQDAGEHEEAAKHLLHGGEMRPEALQDRMKGRTAKAAAMKGMPRPSE